MDAASYIAAAGMKSAYRAVDVATNNLANVNSPGFKADRPFYRMLVDSAGALSGSVMAGTRTDHSPGSLRMTGNPLDLAIKGDGFFAVRTEGGMRYTRNGNFAMSQAGELVTQEGKAVLDNQGRPIVIAPNAGAGNQLSVSRNGDVLVDGVNVATLGIYRFADLASLTKEGNQFFRTPTAPQPMVSPSIEQGALEQSNVNAITAMISLIEMNRIYELNQRAVSTLMNTVNRRAVTEIAAPA